jgi:hypothetical protein
MSDKKPEQTSVGYSEARLDSLEKSMDRNARPPGEKPYGSIFGPPSPGPKAAPPPPPPPPAQGGSGSGDSSDK